MTRITLSEICNADLDRCQSELAAATYSSDVHSIRDARTDVATMLHEMFGPFDLTDSETNDVIREATLDECVESVLAGPEGHILAGGRRCYVAE